MYGEAKLSTSLHTTCIWCCKTLVNQERTWTNTLEGIQVVLFDPPLVGRMNRIVLYLVAIFFVGCTAIMIRSVMFNLAGERFVARLRKKVYTCHT